MNDFDAVVERYLSMWNETDPSARRALLDDLCAPDVRYVDPLAVAEGGDALDALIAGVQQHFPGYVFAADGPVDAHHRQGRFTWRLGPPDGPAPVAGFDVVEWAPDGRISTVLGFLDRVPTD